MNFATCPHCNDPIRLPESALPEGTQAKCPWCLEYFTVDEISQQLPPMVELFDDAGLPIDAVSASAGLGSVVAAEAINDPEPLDSDSIEIAQGIGEELGEDHDDQATQPEFDPNTETWNDNDEPTEHGFATTDETVAFETELGENEPFEVMEDPSADDDANDQDGVMEIDDNADVVPDQDEPGLHDFRIEESGAVSDDSYEVVSDINTGLDSSDLNAGLSPMRVKSSARSKPKKSGLRTLLGIALGPIFALPIAGLIFYLLGTDLGFWPLDGGRSEKPSVQASPIDTSHFDPKPRPDAITADVPSEDDVSASDLATEDPVPQTLASNNAKLNSDTVIADSVTLDDGFWAPPELSEPLPAEASGENPMRVDDSLWSDSAEPLAENTAPGSVSKADVSKADVSKAEQSLPEQGLPQVVPDKPSPANSKPDKVAANPPEVSPTPKKGPKARKKPQPRENANRLAGKESVSDEGLLITNEPEIVSAAKPKVAASSTEATPKPNIKLESPPESETDKAVADAREKLGKLNVLAKTSDKYKPMLAWTYAAVAKVGDVHQGPSDDKLTGLLSDLKQSVHLDDFAASTPQWISYPKRTSEGVVLIGRPGSNGTGPTIELPSGETISIKTDSVAMPGNDKVVAIGRIEGQTPDVRVRLVAAAQAN
tara:strand:+ start:27846 stop:29813 length:1968 start_codon:yes stop_codon:yes gene_type:complete